MADIQRASNPDGSDRCQRTRPNSGQCMNKVAKEGGSYCGACQVPTDKVDSRRLNYAFLKAKVQQDITEKAENSAIKSLREEIGILRLLVERIINKCEDDDDLLIKSPQISDLVTRIEKLVRSCHYLEDQMGDLLDKTAILRFGAQVIELISTEIMDLELLERISGKMITILNSIGNDEGE